MVRGYRVPVRSALSKQGCDRTACSACTMCLALPAPFSYFGQAGRTLVVCTRTWRLGFSHCFPYRSSFSRKLSLSLSLSRSVNSARLAKRYRKARKQTFHVPSCLSISSSSFSRYPLPGGHRRKGYSTILL